jgi:hypothetical protein
MINLEVNLSDLTGIGASAAQASQLSSLSAQSFTSLLSEALSDTLSKLGINPDAITLSVENPPSQSSATSQPSAAVTASPAAAPLAAPSPFAAPAVAALASAAVNPTPSVMTPTATTPAATTAATTPPSPSSALSVSADQAFDESYWSEQPPAVQQLETIQDPLQRSALAENLANEGYSVDVPIMVWGWDPAKVMQARAADGYTWVPSALQQPVSQAPGLGDPGLAPYDPNNPPSGSIMVQAPG